MGVTIKLDHYKVREAPKIFVLLEVEIMFEFKASLN